MTEAQTGTGMTPSPPTTAPRPRARSWRSLLAASEVDTRLLGMVVAIAAIWIAFNILTGGDFLTARNLWNLSVQSTSIAIMATGMVLIIVSRNIDLSVGSLLGFLGYTMALVQTDGTIAFFGIDFTIDGLQEQVLRLGRRARSSACSSAPWSVRRRARSWRTAGSRRSSSPWAGSSSGGA